MRLTLFLLLTAVTVLAQQDTTLLRGKVEDHQGAHVPAVELRLTAARHRLHPHRPLEFQRHFRVRCATSR